MARPLLRRAVRRLNDYIQPDAVAIIGDLVDDPRACDVMDRLYRLKMIIDLIRAPTVVIPGNHDPAPEVFYGVFDRPPDTVDIGPVRLLPFVDPPMPGYNAKREDADLERMRRARRGHDGPIVALQHVPVLPAGTTQCPYGYTNGDDIIRMMEQQAITLAIGGHYHPGTPLVAKKHSAYVTVPAFCETPFYYTLVDLGRHKMPRVISLPLRIRRERWGRVLS